MFDVLFYNRNGSKLMTITEINEEDAKYFQDNNIIVSMEDVNGTIVIYGCPEEDETEESEVIVLANRGQSCKDAMSELVELCKKKFGEKEED